MGLLLYFRTFRLRIKYRSLKLIDDNFDKYVVSMDDYRIPTNEGIGHIPAWNLDGVLNK